MIDLDAIEGRLAVDALGATVEETFALTAALRAEQWISVDERLPDEQCNDFFVSYRTVTDWEEEGDQANVNDTVDVLTYSRDPNTDKWYWHRYDEDGWSIDEKLTVTHWKPINPPEEKDE